RLVCLLVGVLSLLVAAGFPLPPLLSSVLCSSFFGGVGFFPTLFFLAFFVKRCLRHRDRL
ncbi:MAG: hypothetical protein ACK5EH_00530, partial [Pseudanabaena sp.]